MTRRCLHAALGALVLLLLAGSAGAAADEAEQSPEAVVGRLHELLLDIMRNADQLGYQGRYQRLSPVLQELFDLPFMAEKSVGRYWSTATEEDRKTLVETFGRFSAANYAGRFDGYSGQSFQTDGIAPSARGTMVVHTRLIDPTGDDVQLDYRLRPAGEGWKIIDVYLNGTVSELALRRSEYSSLIKREGFKALLVALDERIDSLSTAGAESSS